MPGAFGCGKTVISQAENAACSVSTALCDLLGRSQYPDVSNIQCCRGKVLKGSERSDNSLVLGADGKQWHLAGGSLMPIRQALSKYSNSDVVVYVSWYGIRFFRCKNCEWTMTSFQAHYMYIILYLYICIHVLNAYIYMFKVVLNVETFTTDRVPPTLFLHIAWRYKPSQPIGNHSLWPCPLRVISK